MKIHEFDPVIYPFRLWIIIDKNPNEISDIFNDYEDKTIEHLDHDTCKADAFVMPVARKEDPCYGVIVFFRSKKDLSSYELVAHESSHAAKYLFEHIGADMQAHEPFEYVVGWIAGCIDKVRKGKVNE